MEVAEVTLLMPNTRSRKLWRTLKAAGLWRTSDAIPGIADSVHSATSDHRAQEPHEALVPQSTIRNEYLDCYTDKGNSCSILIHRRHAPRRIARGAQHASFRFAKLASSSKCTRQKLPPRKGDGKQCCTDTDIAFAQRPDVDMCMYTIILALKPSEQVTKGSHHCFVEMTSDTVQCFDSFHLPTHGLRFQSGA